MEWGAPRKRNAPTGHLTGRVPLSLAFPDGTQPRPGHQLYPGGGRHRRPAQVPEPSFRPSPRPIPSPGGSGAPAGRSGAPPEARKAPKSKGGLPRPLVTWKARGARRRFRPLETVGTASNTCAMGWVVLGGRGAAGGAPV